MDTRTRLIKIMKKIQDCQDKGRSWASLLSELKAAVPMPLSVLESLLEADMPSETKVDMAIGWKHEWPILSREGLVELVRKIMNAEGSEAEVNLMVLQFKANCKHPARSDLIFWPDGHFGEGIVEPTPEQVVDLALKGN